MNKQGALDESVSATTGVCMRKKQSASAKNAPVSTSTEEELPKQAQNDKAVVKKWKHILLKVKNRKRLVNGKFGTVIQASNILTGDKTMLMVDPKLIDEQDVPGLEKLLRDKVELADSDVSIFIQISEKMLKKRAYGP